MAKSGNGFVSEIRAFSERALENGVCFGSGIQATFDPGCGHPSRHAHGSSMTVSDGVTTGSPRHITARYRVTRVSAGSFLAVATLDNPESRVATASSFLKLLIVQGINLEARPRRAPTLGSGRVASPGRRENRFTLV
ncbi:hypothetical protein Bbelb_189110 [Branchiostoma belcheri]|nr:hypothetical protein Bbelb_189110 [Branchiostoma belcheri]